MYQPLEIIPISELSQRWAKVRGLLRRHVPEAGGLMTFSRVAAYYLTGTMAPGVCWLPLQGEPLLMLRKGRERARLESPLSSIVTFRSYADLDGLAREAGCPLPEVLAAEQSGLTWGLGQNLATKLSGKRCVPGDMVLAMAQSLKTPWELAKMRLAGERHAKCLMEIVPARIRPGMTEREISHIVWEAFFSQGHSGLMRMGAFGEEIFLGHVSAGDSGNYPSFFNGPLGLRGEHPATTAMGYAGKVWSKGEPLALDVGFVLEGYHTDKTQLYWAGARDTIPKQVRRGHDFCMRVQEWIAERMKPGAIPSALYAHCVRWAEEEGLADGFMGLGGNQVRFIGHGIGLVVDGWPVIAKGFDEPLEEGMVMALEPKQGIPGLGMVGVENTFEVTPDGGRCLTGAEFDFICLE